jgi:hypothetical protein
VFVKRKLAVRDGMQLVADTVAALSQSWMMICVVALAAAAPAIAQNAEMQQKLEVVKEAVAQNKQKLQQYQWIETTQLDLKGDAKPPSQDSCRYDSSGQIQKTPISAPPPPPSGGRMKKRIIEKKTDEIKEYMGEVKALLSMYVPPDAQKMQQAYQAGKFSLNPVGDAMNLVFRDYAQSGDQMTLAFDPAKLAVTSLSINTYMGEAKDVVTLNVQMAMLPDGTNYQQQTVLDATAKKLVVTTTNSSYQKIGGQ